MSHLNLYRGLLYSEGGWGRTNNCDPTSHGEGARLVPTPTQPCNKDLGANNLFVGLPHWLSGSNLPAVLEPQETEA